MLQRPMPFFRSRAHRQSFRRHRNLSDDVLGFSATSGDSPKDHVVRDGGGRLTHKFYDSDAYFSFPKAFASEMFPLDLAASPVDLTWTATAHSAMAFPEHRMALTHAPVSREFLFLMGFAGSRAYFSPILNVIVTSGTPYLTQEFDSQAEEREIACEDYDPAFHFAIPWEPEQVEIIDRENNVVPVNANGFSGCLRLREGGDYRSHQDGDREEARRQ
jgi:hypothetical protein